MNKRKVIIEIRGMHCTACAKTIEKALKKQTGITNVNVNFATEKALVEYDPNRADLDRITAVIREAGYEPIGTSEAGGRTRRVSLKIAGMHCASCAATIEKALKKLEGVKSARVNFATERASVEYSPEIISVLDLRRSVQDAGYEVESEEEVDRSIQEIDPAP